MTEHDNKWIDKLQALMRKAEDPATSEHERENIIDRVTYLMTKYGIEQDMLRSQEQRPLTASHRKLLIVSPYVNKKAVLLNQICIAFGCMMVDTSSRDNDRVSIFGTDEDIERVFMLYMSLILQMDIALAQAQTHKPNHEHGKTFNGSFINGFVFTVMDRIRVAAARAKNDLKREMSGNGMELVLLNKAELIKNLLLDTFPNVGIRVKNIRSTSETGYGAGRSAGQRADIGGARISGTHSARRAISS